MILEFFILGTFWFYILLAAEAGILITCTAKELGRIASLSIVAFLVTLQLFSNFDVLSFIYHNPVVLLVGLLVYLICGFLCVFPKWWLFCKDHARRYFDLKGQFLENKHISGNDIPEELIKEWHGYFRDHTRTYHYNESQIEFKPSARKHKNRIIFWMTLWPLVMTWTLLNDPIVRFCQHIYYEIAGVLQRISDGVFKDYEHEMKGYSDGGK